MERLTGASFKVYALLNGTSVIGHVGVINGPLRQEYTEGGNNYAPDWETAANKPLIYAHLNLSAGGEVLVPSVVEMEYNGVKIAFDAAGLSTTGNMAGVFKKSVKTLNIQGRDFPNMIVFEIIKNLVPISNKDNDTIMLSGSGEVSGQSLGFSALTQTVEIVKAVSGSTTLYIDGDKAITSSFPTATLNAHVTINGITPDNVNSFDFKWYKIKGSQSTLFKTGPSVTVVASDVDGTSVFRCDLTKRGDNVVIQQDHVYVIDYTDPYRVVLYQDGVIGEYVAKGQTVIITAKVEKSDGTVMAGVTTYFNVRDNNGNVIAKYTGEKSSISITYDDLVNYNSGITGEVSASYNL